MGWGTKVCSNDPDHMKKWPPCPYRVKTFKSLPRWNQKANGLVSASGTQVLSNLFK